MYQSIFVEIHWVKIKGEITTAMKFKKFLQYTKSPI